MPTSHDPFDEWLAKVAADLIHLDASEGGLIAEARTNPWGFGFSDEELRDVSVEASCASCALWRPPASGRS